MTNNKPYYEDPRIASLMQEWHGVNYVDIKGHHLEIRDNYDGFMAGGRFPKKAYIHPDSMHIFDAKERDEGWATIPGNSAQPEYKVKVTNKGLMKLNFYPNEYTPPEYKMTNITERDNKPFFWPKWSKEDKS